jgi:hypothetical protein
MRKKTIIILSVIIILIFESCCRSNECKCNDRWGYKVSDCTPRSFGPYPLGGAKDYLYFKQGSYWIYKNSYTGELDSLYMAYCDTFVQTTKGMDYRWLDVTYTAIEFKLRSDIHSASYHSYTQRVLPDVTGFDPNNFFSVQFCEMTFDGPKSGTSGYIFQYPFPLKVNPNKYEHYNQIKWSDSTFYDVGVFYNDVYSFDMIRMPKNVPGGCGPANFGKFYWGKGVGIIAMEDSLYLYSNNEKKLNRWELIRYHLEK